MTLSRRQALSLVGAACVAPRAFAAPRLQYDIIPKQVASGLWMIEGTTEYFSSENGGAIVNCTLLESNDGMIVIDSGPSLRYGEALIRAINQISPNGVAAVINTHHHPDHFFGNQAFQGLPIYALGETKVLAQTHGAAFADNMYVLLGDWMRGTEATPPNLEISGGELEIAGRKLDMIPLVGHTEADLAVLDTQTGILIAGDLAFLDRAPTTPSADLTLWKQSIEILRGIDAAAIIPGHGPLDTTSDSLAQTRDYLIWLEATLRNAANDGLDMVEIMSVDLPLHFAKMGAMPQEFHRSVTHLYSDIENQSLPRAN